MASMMVTPFLDVKPRPALSRTTTIVLNLLVATAYLLTGYVGLRLAFVGGAVTLFWPPSGIAFGAIWLGGYRLLPGVFAGAFLVNLIAIGTPALAALVALGNTAAAPVGTYLLRRMIERRGDPGELQRVVMFVLVGALGSTIISATFGTFTLTMLSNVSQSVRATWPVWWMGDAMGVLIVAPPILIFRRLVAARVDCRGVLAAAVCIGAGLAIIAAQSYIREPIWAVELCKLFTLLLSLWAGARFGLNGPAAITLLMTIGAVSVTTLGVGPFVRGDFYDRFALVHSYLFAVAVAGMLLAAALADLRRTLASEKLAHREAEAASGNRIRLLTMVGHDVRTPLSGMMSALQALDRACLEAEQRRLVGLGLRAGMALTTLVGDMFEVARADAGRITLDPAPFSPTSSLSDIAESSRAAAERKGLTLVLKEIGPLPALLIGDRVRFEQLLGNLIGNAVNYTVEGSVVVTAEWKPSPPALTIEVADTGPGIDARSAAALSGLAADEPRSAGPSAGLGLGLYICRHLVALMRGTISCDVDPAGGSRFRVVLPLPDAGPLPAPPPSPVETDPSYRILLVEDDEIAREATGALLESHNHRVTLAPDAETAVSFARDHRFDLILMDIQLDPAGISGLDAVRRIREMPGPAGTPIIIALTGGAIDGRHEALGLDGVLAKPLTMRSGIGGLLRDLSPGRRPAPNLAD